MNLFDELCKLAGVDCDKSTLFNLLFNNSLNGDVDCGGMMAYGFHSGEHAVGLSEGRPLFVRDTNDNFNLANFIRLQIYCSFAAMKVGIDTLLNEENASVDKIIAQGGLFNTPSVAQSYLAAAIGKPVEVMTTASEGGPWGIALLASYLGKDCSLCDYCDKIFSNAEVNKVEPTEKEIEGYNKFYKKYIAGIPVEKLATELL